MLDSPGAPIGVTSVLIRGRQEGQSERGDMRRADPEGGAVCFEGEHKRQPTPVLLSRKCHGQKCLAGYSPWGLKSVRHDL